MSQVVIFGASDDLVEIEGSLREEFNVNSDESVVLVFGDGTVLTVRYDMMGVWRIQQTAAGTADFFMDEDPGDDEERYSDRVTLTGDLRWVVQAEQSTLHRIPV